MAFASRSLIFVLFFIILVEATKTDRRCRNCWSPIHSLKLKDPKVIDLAKFAVSEHNKKANTHLHFVSVTYGLTQGSKFKLYIFTTDGDIAGHPRTCVAIVSLKQNQFILESFEQMRGHRPIKDLKDALVVDIAKFAVSEHNKKANTHLHFVSVINGYTQVVAGTRFTLVISATDDDVGGHPINYLAVVWARTWLKENPFILTSFKQLQD